MNKSKKSGKSDDSTARPPQHQPRQPGRETDMVPQPESCNPDIKGSNSMKGKVVLITGGDSGIGRATAISFAREGANVAIVYLEEQEDAETTAKKVKEYGVDCCLIKGDIASDYFCRDAIDEVTKEFGKLDVLINNAAEQHPKEDFESISQAQLEATFRTNVFAMFYLVRAALPHLRKSKGCIINTTSVTAYRGSPQLVDYSATKGAIVAFTRSLSQKLVEDGIRVNAVAPGPIWTPLIPSTFDAETVKTFGSDSPMGRAGQPWECAECFLFLASPGASYMTGQVLHPNGGEIVNG